jgi:hypothetical protein
MTLLRRVPRSLIQLTLSDRTPARSEGPPGSTRESGGLPFVCGPTPLTYETKKALSPLARSCIGEIASMRLNHPQFSNLGSVFGTSTFARITQTSVGLRLIPFGVKHLF